MSRRIVLVHVHRLFAVRTRMSWWRAVELLYTRGSGVMLTLTTINGVEFRRPLQGKIGDIDTVGDHLVEFVLPEGDHVSNISYSAPSSCVFQFSVSSGTYMGDMR